MIAALGLGLVIGVLLGLVGGGGSILAVPALVYGVGIPLATAIPTALLVVGISSAAAAVPRIRRGDVRWRIAGIFGVAGMAAAYGGAAVNPLLEPWVVLLGFATLMVVAGIRMLYDQVEVGGDCALPGGGINWRSCLPKAIGAGAAVGFLTGLFGVGGGFLVVPALALLLGLALPEAVGTSLVIVVLNSTAGFLSYAGQVQLDYPVTAVFTASAITGSLAATRLGTRVPVDRLQRWFAYLILLVAALVVVQLIVAPAAVR